MGTVNEDILFPDHNPNQVLAFYKQQLMQEGWTSPLQDGDAYLSINNEVALPFYALEVRTVVTRSGSANVELSLTSSPCFRD